MEHEPGKNPLKFGTGLRGSSRNFYERKRALMSQQIMHKS